MLPPFLKPGDLVAILSPSGTVDSQFIDSAALQLSSWGLTVRVMPHAKSSFGSFAGTPEDRLSDLQAAISDPQVKAILCSRGGYGAIQIVDQLDISSFEVSPKWIIGFSDITVLHSLCTAVGVASVHGVMAKHIATLPSSVPAVKCLRDLLFGKLPSYSFSSDDCRVPTLQGDLVNLNRPGSVKGRLVGGNLSLVYALRATPFDIDAYSRENILFIEDVSERPYQVDRMINNLRLSGVLENIKGLIVGQFSDYEEDGRMMRTVHQIIRDAVEEYDYPVLFNFPAGHVEDNRPLLMGANVELSVSRDDASVNFVCKQ